MNEQLYFPGDVIEKVWNPNTEPDFKQARMVVEHFAGALYMTWTGGDRALICTPLREQGLRISDPEVVASLRESYAIWRLSQ